MPVSCFASSAPASQGSCFGALLKACKRTRSASWGAGRTDEFEKNPHFKKTSEDEFHKLYKVKKTIGVGGQTVIPHSSLLTPHSSLLTIYHSRK